MERLQGAESDCGMSQMITLFNARQSIIWSRDVHKNGRVTCNRRKRDTIECRELKLQKPSLAKPSTRRNAGEPTQRNSCSQQRTFHEAHI